MRLLPRGLQRTRRLIVDWIDELNVYATTYEELDEVGISRHNPA